MILKIIILAKKKIKKGYKRISPNKYINSFY